MSDIRIRPMTESDLDAVAALIVSLPLFQRYGVTKEGMLSLYQRALQNPESRIWVAEFDHRVCAVAWYMIQGAFGRSSYLRTIACDANVQGKGIGRRLIETAEAELLVPNGLFLLVTKENREAQHFYEKLGYHRVGEIPDYVKDGIDEYIYFKQGRTV